MWVSNFYKDFPQNILLHMNSKAVKKMAHYILYRPYRIGRALEEYEWQQLAHRMVYFEQYCRFSTAQ